MEGGWTGEIPVYIDEPTAVAAELDRTEGSEKPEVIALLCHEDREGVSTSWPVGMSWRVDDPAELARLVASG